MSTNQRAELLAALEILGECSDGFGPEADEAFSTADGYVAQLLEDVDRLKDNVRRFVKAANNSVHETRYVDKDYALAHEMLVRMLDG